MFISNEEKKTIIQKIDGLTTQCERIAFEVIGLMAKVKKLEEPKPKKAKKPLTAAQKAKQRAYQKAYNERKKAKQLAEGNTNVSA